MPGGSLFVRRDDVGLRCANPTYGATALGVPRPWRDLRACMHPGILPGLALPVGLPERWRRVVRGGSWNNEPENLRSANRNRNNADNRNNNIGFRLAQSARAALGRARSRSVEGQAGCGAWVSMSPFPGLARRGAPNSTPGMAGPTVSSSRRKPPVRFVPAGNQATRHRGSAGKDREASIRRETAGE